MTGAALPKGADAVVPLEATDAYNENANLAFPNQIHLTSPVNPDDYVRPEGSDIKQSDIVLNPGERLRPQEIGLLAMLGISQVTIYRPPRIALLSTGNELATINQSLQPGKIYDANSFSLGSLILQYGCELFNLGIAKDEIDDVQSRLDEAVDQGVDLIISSAGVSVGAFDYVRYVLTNYGKLAFWRINIRPGKPLAFGAYRGNPFVGLPCNPV
jgi:molybdopterin molybdotransferase